VRSITLYSQAQAQQIIARLVEWMTPRLADGKRLRLSIGEETRSLAQNAKLHATIDEISRQCDWAGRKWDAEVWKRLLVAAWMRANGQQMMVVPALDGAGVDVVFQRTSTLSKAECSELLEFVQAWAAEHGVSE
jgi:hypothetical protein